jgi:hypothetical protein
MLLASSFFCNGFKPKPRSGRLAGRLRRLDNAENIAFLHDQQVLPIDLDLALRPFAEKHTIAGFEVRRHEFTSFVANACANGDDFAFLRLFLALSGMTMPPGVFSSALMRRTRTRSCNGRKCMQILHIHNS